MANYMSDVKTYYSIGVTEEIEDDFIPHDPDFYQKIFDKYDKSLWNGWYMVGTAVDETNSYCGTFTKVRICEDHKAYLKVVSKNCRSLGCRTCHSGAEIQRASRIEEKLLQVYRETSQIYRHITLSPLYDLEGKDSPVNFDFLSEKNRILCILKEFCYGGVLFFHAWRFNKEDLTMRWSPHWHAVVSCEFFTEELGEHYGMIIKNIRWTDFEEPDDTPIATEWEYENGKCKKVKPYVMGVGTGRSAVNCVISYILSHVALKDRRVTRKVKIKDKEDDEEATIKKVRRILKEDRQGNAYSFFGNCSTRYMHIESVEKINIPIKCPICKKQLKECCSHAYTNGLTSTVKDFWDNDDEVCISNTITEVNVDEITRNNEWSDSFESLIVVTYKFMRYWNTQKSIKAYLAALLSMEREILV